MNKSNNDTKITNFEVILQEDLDREMNLERNQVIFELTNKLKQEKIHNFKQQLYIKKLENKLTTVLLELQSLKTNKQEKDDVLNILNS